MPMKHKIYPAILACAFLYTSVAAADANGTEVGDAELSEIIVNAMPFIGEEESIPLEYILFLTPRRLRTR